MMFIVSDPHHCAVSTCILKESARGLRASCSLNLSWVAPDQLPFVDILTVGKHAVCAAQAFEIVALAGSQCINFICHWTKSVLPFPPSSYGGWIAELFLSQHLLYVICFLIYLSLPLFRFS